MDNTKKQIGVYKTGEYGAILFENNLHKSLLRLHLDKDVEIVQVEAKDITNQDFMNNLAGIAMPGRNRGQQYRDEWGTRGYQNINIAVEQHGLSILAVCAASAVLCKEVSWHNPFDPNGDKRVVNEDALFPGIAVGAFNNQWHDGYRSVSKPDAYHSNVLAAKVLPVEYTRALSGVTHGTSGHAVYWGGCVFIADHDSELRPHIRTLVKHQNRVTTPLVYDNNVPIKKAKASDFINPGAVIEFPLGKGTVIMSNIHPEIDGEIFGHLFHTMPQARQDLEAFEEDKNKILQSDTFGSMLFDRFVKNCVQPNETAKKSKKALAAL